MSSQCPSKWGLKNKGMASLKKRTFFCRFKKVLCDLRCNANILYTIERNTFVFWAVTGSDHIQKKSIDSNVFATDELPLFYARPFAACHFPILLFNFPTPLRCWSKIRKCQKNNHKMIITPLFNRKKESCPYCNILTIDMNQILKGFFFQGIHPIRFVLSHNQNSLWLMAGIKVKITDLLFCCE